MDISMNEINSLTLNYFTNKAQYGNILKRTNLANDVAFVEDKKFYKKRIMDLNKRLFRNEIQDTQLLNHFNNYIRSCISYFKLLDTSEIIQQQYEDMDINIDNKNEVVMTKNSDIDDINYSKCDYLLMKNDDVKSFNLDTFVVKTKTNDNDKKQILPTKTVIKLNSKRFKTKGLEKKKNINNKYEKSHEQNNVQNDEQT